MRSLCSLLAAAALAALAAAQVLDVSTLDEATKIKFVQ